MLPVDKKISKKEARQLIYNKLALALAEFKDILKEKRFSANLKRASKLFAADLAKASGKLNGKVKKKEKKGASTRNRR